MQYLFRLEEFNPESAPVPKDQVAFVVDEQDIKPDHNWSAFVELMIKRLAERS